MSFYKTSLLILAMSFCIGYMFYTRQYFSYCQYAKSTGDYMVDDDKKEFYMQICEDAFKDYSNHTIMKYSLELIYSFFVYNERSRDINLEKFIQTKSFANIKFELKTLKFIHFAFYLIVLYFLIICAPRLILDICLYFVDKLLFLFFIILLAEGVANLYMDVNIDVMGLTKKLYSFLPINFASGIFLDFLKGITEVFNR
jgi:hypothetical protein